MSVASVSGCFQTADVTRMGVVEPSAASRMEMQGRVVLVTGANTGIGKVTASELARLGARVLMSGRNAEALEEAAAEIRAATGSVTVATLVADLSVMDEVRQLAEDVRRRTERLDVLVNNAGLILAERRVTADGLETTFAVNHLAPFLLTGELMPLLEASAPSRVVTVASGWHSAVTGLDFDDLQAEQRYDGKVVYQRSKLANILFTRELARRIAGTGVTANCLHPGVVRTDFARNGDMGGALHFFFSVMRPFFLSPEKGARTTITLASDPGLVDATGGYYAKSKLTEPSAAARDDTAAARLWDQSTTILSALGYGKQPVSSAASAPSERREAS